MANQPKTPAKAFRIPEELWQKVEACAQAEGITYTEVVVRALTDYLTEVEEPGG